MEIAMRRASFVAAAPLAIALSAVSCGNNESAAEPSGAGGTGGTSGAGSGGGGGGGGSSGSGNGGASGASGTGGDSSTAGAGGAGPILTPDGGYVPPPSYGDSGTVTPAPGVDGGSVVVPPSGFDGTGLDQGNRVTFSLNYDWQWIKQAITGAEAPGFADTAAGWITVSLPHTWNDIDQYDDYAKMNPGFGWTGITWYRKHFKLPADQAGKKVFLEMEGLRQVGKFYINGQLVGLHDNGVGPAGFDLTPYAKFGTEENVLAINVSNRGGDLGSAKYNWDTAPFHPNYGGIIKNAWLHLTDKVHQTLPLFSNLGTQGVFVYAKNVDVTAKTAQVVVEAEIANEGAASANVVLGVLVYDMTGTKVASGSAPAQAVAAGAKPGVVLTATAELTGARFWEPAYPYVYRVESTLTVDGTLVDGTVAPFGVKTVGFTAKDGLLINGHPLFLDGYAQRASNTYVAIGQGTNWVEEWDYSLLRDSRANFVRPMHVAPRIADVQAADKFGVVMVVPAGDSENVAPNQARLDLMRDMMIYARNNPSVMFWETGNEAVGGAGAQQMKAVYDKYIGLKSPTMIGSRSTDDGLVPTHTYLSSMDGPATSALVPAWAAEYCKAEVPRRVWDAYSPMLKTDGTIAPSGGYKMISTAIDAPNLRTYDPINTQDFGVYGNSMEDLALENTRRLYEHWKLRGGQGLAKPMVGGAKIIFADCESHGRLYGEVARASGAVDGARLPKEPYFALGAAHSTEPAIHILGHWNYAAGTVKPVFVIASPACEEIRMTVLDPGGAVIKDYGAGTRTKRNYFAVMYDAVAFQPGMLRATCLVGGVEKAKQEKVTAGDVAGIKITAMAGPENALRADGSDQGWFDVEAVDAQGRRNPVDNGLINLSLAGDSAIFRGGYNSGLEKSINADNSPTQKLYIENGVNRVYVRATRKPGTITLTVKRDGFADATATMVVKAFDLTDGLTKQHPKALPSPIP
jgi:beta-galactosidase